MGLCARNGGSLQPLEWRQGSSSHPRVDAGEPIPCPCALQGCSPAVCSPQLWGLGCALGSLQVPAVSLLCAFPVHNPVSRLLFSPLL